MAEEAPEEVVTALMSFLNISLRTYRRVAYRRSRSGTRRE